MCRLIVNKIIRIGDSERWSDVVIHNGVARWVEIASDRSRDAEHQIEQVLDQIDETLPQIGSDRESLLQILIYLTNPDHLDVLNRLWDKWVPKGHAPVRACVHCGLSGGCHVEMIITAAVTSA